MATNCPLTKPEFPTFSLDINISIPSGIALPKLPQLPTVPPDSEILARISLACPRKKNCPYISRPCPMNYTDRQGAT